MGPAGIETSIREDVKLPDFTFPPRYAPSQDPMPAQPIGCRIPLSFGFPLTTIPHNPTPTPISMPEITSPLTPLSPIKPSTLLSIPLEIRLQIYHYVLLTHPIYHAHLAPLNPPTSFSGLNTEEFHTTMLRPTPSSIPSTHTTRTLITKALPEQKISTLYPISTPTTTHPRVQGKIPTALLVSCKQVFEECRLLPWEANTFTFINWFWSGVYASRQFTRGLMDWQRESIRWVGVEVLARDLKVDGMGRLGGGIGGGATRDQGAVGEWWDLCQLWRGVWGIRLGVKGSVAPGKKVEVDGSGGGNGEDGSAASSGESHNGDRAKGEKTDEGVLDVRKEWVVDGLLQMRNLQWIELEIEDEDVDRETKLQFCVELEGVFNSPSSYPASSSNMGNNGKEQRERNVRVIFVERIKVEEKPVSNDAFVWYGGTPGDDSIWGLDM